MVVLPFGVPPSRMPVLSKLPRLRLIQLMSAGAENAIPFVPPGVTLCNARGVHDPAVAEWVMAVILAQTRQLPRFVAAQQAGTWDPVAPGLLLTPHVAGAMTTAMPRVMTVVRDQLARYAAGEPLLNIVGEQGY